MMVRLVWWLLLAMLVSGCAPFWSVVREHERGYAARNAERRIASGDCAAALSSIERAQAKEDLGVYAAASTLQKARCLDQLGEVERSRAHYRLLRDFYPDYRAEQLASEFDEEDGSLEEARIEAEALGSHPALQLDEPRFSASADRSHLGGSVLVRYWVGADGATQDLRVLTMPHPLLASWAIEAVAKARLPKDAVANRPRAAVTRFLFQARVDRWQDDSEPE